MFYVFSACFLTPFGYTFGCILVVFFSYSWTFAFPQRKCDFCQSEKQEFNRSRLTRFFIFNQEMIMFRYNLFSFGCSFDTVIASRRSTLTGRIVVISTSFSSRGAMFSSIISRCVPAQTARYSILESRSRSSSGSSTS